MPTAAPFTGLDDLTENLDRAVAAGRPEDITAGVQEILCRSIAGGIIELPERLRRVKPGSYARRLVYQSPRHGYTVLAMTWGPEQGTPLHDHAGIWCVEGVVGGTLEVVRYELVDRGADPDHCRFVRREAVSAGVGSAGSLIPPHEYHTLTNTSSETPAVTLHVYGGPMTHCNIFEPQPDGWYLRRERRLHLDD